MQFNWPHSLRFYLMVCDNNLSIYSSDLQAYIAEIRIILKKYVSKMLTMRGKLLLF